MANQNIEDFGAVTPDTNSRVLIVDGLGGAIIGTAPVGDGDGDLLAANNLSDLVNATTARDNLALGAANDVAFADLTLDNDLTVGGDATFTDNVTIQDTVPRFILFETDAPTDRKYCTLDTSFGTFRIRMYDDAFSSFVSPLAITRIGTTVTDFDVTANDSSFSGDVEIGVDLSIIGGLVVGAPTGGNKGTGTINATGVYDDNVLLTCAPLHDDMKLKDWDELGDLSPIYETRTRTTIVERATIGARVVQVATLGIVKPKEEVVEEKYQVVIGHKKPEHRTVRRHIKLAKTFDTKSHEEFTAKTRADKAVPGMPTVEEWRSRGLGQSGDKTQPHDKPGLAEMTERMSLALDYQALAIGSLSDEVVTLRSDLSKALDMIKVLQSKVG